MSPIQAAITAVGGYVPDYVMTNAELETLVDTNDEWIVSRTGIKERRVLKGEGNGTSVIGTAAVQEILDKTGMDPLEINVIICATVTPDMMFPNTANLVATNIGAKNALSFDMSAACTGFLYALETGVNYIKSGLYKNVIVIGADKMSAAIDYTDRSTCIIFGDGGGAVLLQPSQNGYGVLDSILKSDATHKDLIYFRGHGSASPLTVDSLTKGEHYFYQDGKAVFKHAVTNMSNVTLEIMERNNLHGDDISWLVPHQANQRIIDAVAKRMEIDEDKITKNIVRYGNTTSGTIPLCFWDWEDQFKKGDNLILAAFGGGFTWGATYLKWGY